jgi:hypothetical protein
MRSPFAALSVAVMLASASPYAVSAQASSWTVGALAGLNLSRYSGSAAVFDDEDAVQKWKPDFLLGLSLARPISPNLTFAPELLYTRKGINVDFEFDLLGEPLTSNVKSTVSYLEVPFLFRLHPAKTSAAYHPYLFAGPTVAIRVACRVASTSSFAGETESDSGDCDEGEDEGEGMRKNDIGGMVGGGLSYRKFDFSARYERSLRTLDQSDDKEQIFNSVLSFTVGIRLSGAK